MTTLHSIHVIAYFADMETFNELHLISPYTTAEARDRDVIRLATLPGNNGDAVFVPSCQDPAAADHTCTPEQVAAVKHFNQVVGALYGFEVDDNGDDVRRDAVVAAPVAPRRRRARQTVGQGDLFTAGGAA